MTDVAARAGFLHGLPRRRLLSRLVRLPPTLGEYERVVVLVRDHENLPSPLRRARGSAKRDASRDQTNGSVSPVRVTIGDVPLALAPGARHERGRDRTQGRGAIRGGRRHAHRTRHRSPPLLDRDSARISAPCSAEARLAGDGRPGGFSAIGSREHARKRPRARGKAKSGERGASGGTALPADATPRSAREETPGERPCARDAPVEGARAGVETSPRGVGATGGSAC